MVIAQERLPADDVGLSDKDYRHHRRLGAKSGTLPGDNQPARASIKQTSRPASSRSPARAEAQTAFNPAGDLLQLPVDPLRRSPGNCYEGRGRHRHHLHAHRRGRLASTCAPGDRQERAGSTTLDCTGLQRDLPRTRSRPSRRRSAATPTSATRSSGRRHRGSTRARCSSATGSAVTPTAAAARRSPTRTRPTWSSTPTSASASARRSSSTPTSTTRTRTRSRSTRRCAPS